MKISTVIPIYNEELAIAENVGKVVKALDALKKDWELVLVNDGSTDKTLSIIQDMTKANPKIKVISYIPNRGRGYALKMGFKNSIGDYIIATESDLNWGTEIFDRFVEELDKGSGDIIIASPHMKGGRMENVPLFRRLLSRLGNVVFSIALPGRLTMSTGMTRAYRREVLDSIDFESEDKEMHVEILYKALDLGFKIKEIPAVLIWKKTAPGANVRKSHFKFKSILKHLLLSFNVRPYLLFGAIGALLIIVGIVLGVYLLYLSSIEGVAGRPLLFATVLIIVVGFQMIVFGFLATQNRDINRQLIRTQKLIKDLLKK